MFFQNSILKSVLNIFLTSVCAELCLANFVVTDIRDQCNETFSISIALQNIAEALRQIVSKESSPILTENSVWNEIDILKKEYASAQRDFDKLRESFDKEFKDIKEENEHLKGQLSMHQKKQSVWRVPETGRDIGFSGFEKFKENAGKTIDDMKTELRYMSLSLLSVKEHNREIGSKITKTAEERHQDVNRAIETIKSNVLQSPNNGSAILDVRMADIRFNISRLITDISVRVGFTAGVTTTEKYWYGGRFYFPRVIYAVGGGYDSKTSIFTSPVEGEYVFFLSIVAHRYSYLYLDIKLNGYVKARVFATGRDAEDWQKGEKDAAASDLVYLHLKKGDRVWVHYYYGTGYRSNKDVPLMTFSGFKI